MYTARHHGTMQANLNNMCDVKQHHKLTIIIKTTAKHVCDCVLYLQKYGTRALSILFNTPKNPNLNQATQRNTCQIFVPKKIFRKLSQISNPKKSFHHPCHSKWRVPPLGFCFTAI